MWDYSPPRDAVGLKVRRLYYVASFQRGDNEELQARGISVLRNLTRGLIVGLFISFLIMGCSGTDDGQERFVLDRGLAGNPDTLDPHRGTSTQGHRIQVDLFEGLLRYDEEGRLSPGVAQDWNVSEDGLLYTFNLRRDARWSNGDPVTAGDFEYAFKRLVNPDTAAFYATFLRMVGNADDIIAGRTDPNELAVEVVNDYQLIVRLEQPTIFFPQLLTHPAASPLHRGTLEEHGLQWSQSEFLVSNGAYKTALEVPGSYYELMKNEFFHAAGNVAIEKVRWHVIVDNSAMYNRYRAGELEITSTVPTPVFKMVMEERPTELKVTPLLGVYYYGFNLTREPFMNNPKLRKALSMVVDRDVLVKIVTGRGELPAFGFVPPGIEGYEPARFKYANWPYERRVTEAQRLYAEAGYSRENPAKFEVRYNVGEGEQKIALVLQSMWKEQLGAEVELINEEHQVLISNIQQGHNTQAFRLSWVGDYFDPLTFLELGQSGNQQNLTAWSNKRYDELMKTASIEQEAEKRMALLNEAEGIFINDHPLIPLYFYVSKHLVSNEIVGWRNTLVDFHPSRYLSFAGDE
jgi:ABC-type oligopeptide transport system substrate-binding subunit